MKVRKVLVSYRNETDKKKLEDYIREVTDNPIDLGDVGYDGALTINTMNIDLTNVNRTNITCAAAYPGPKFAEVDKFIKWHKRISKMGYIEALNNISGPNDIIALYYDSKNDNISYVCLTMYDKSCIEKYIGLSDGKAISFDLNKNKYWLLISKENNNALLFRNTVKDNISSYSVDCSNKELEDFKYFINL